MLLSYRSDYVYPIEEIVRESEQAEKNLERGKLPVFATPEAMFKALNLPSQKTTVKELI